MKYTVLFLLLLTAFFSGCKKQTGNTAPPAEEELFAQKIWHWNNYISGTSVPAIDNNDNSYYLFQTNNNSNKLSLLSLDKNGNLRWIIRDKFGEGISACSPVFVNNRLYFVTNNSIVYCYDSNGKELWKSSKLFNLDRKVVVVNDEVYVLSFFNQKYLYKFNNKGQVKWTLGYPGFKILNIIALNNKLYLLGNTNEEEHPVLASVSSTNGNIIWKSTLESVDGPPVGSAFCVDGEGYIYFFTKKNRLISAKGFDGSVRWWVQLENSSYTPNNEMIVTDDNHIIFSHNNLYCFDIKGEELWHTLLYSHQTFALGDNNIAYGWGSDGRSSVLFAINVIDGTIVSKVSNIIGDDFLNRYQPPAIDHRGNILTEGHHGVYCLSSLSTGLRKNCWAKWGKGYGNNTVREVGGN